VKICWCHSHFGQGGGPITLFTWAKGLRKLGCEIEFVGEGGTLTERVRRAGFSVHFVSNRRRPSFLNAWRYAQVAKHMEAEVIVGVGTFSGMEAALAAFFLRKPFALDT